MKSTFLQGLPFIGPAISNRSLNHFGNIRSIAITDIHELQRVRGIGRKNSVSIFNYTSEGNYRCD